MNKKDWTKEAISSYISHGVTCYDATKLAEIDALEEESKHGSVVVLWEPADSLVSDKMQQWSMSV